MPFTLDENTVAGRIIAANAEARGEARGEARAEARGHARLMRHTFGDDPRIGAIAERLAHLDGDRVFDIVLSAKTIDELAALADGEPSSGASAE